MHLYAGVTLYLFVFFFFFLLISQLQLTRPSRHRASAAAAVGVVAVFSCPSPKHDGAVQVLRCAAGSVSVSILLKLSRENPFDFFVVVFYVCSCLVLSRLSNKENVFHQRVFYFMFLISSGGKNALY